MAYLILLFRKHKRFQFSLELADWPTVPPVVLDLDGTNCLVLSAEEGLYLQTPGGVPYQRVSIEALEVVYGP